VVAPPLLAERLVVERLLVERLPVERPPVDRALVDRVEVLPLAPDRVVDEAARALDCVSAVRSLSKSFNAWRLVFAASRRSARSAAVTSL
jgi:hypothetical protein